jgi:hypothetical protein
MWVASSGIVGGANDSRVKRESITHSDRLWILFFGLEGGIATTTIDTERCSWKSATVISWATKMINYSDDKE